MGNKKFVIKVSKKQFADMMEREEFLGPKRKRPRKYSFGDPVNNLSQEDNFLLQKYIKDSHDIVEVNEEIIKSICKDNNNEVAFRNASLNYIENKYDDMAKICRKDPDKIYPGYTVSYNAYRYLATYLDNDYVFLNAYYESLYQRFYTCVIQNAYFFDEKQMLFNLDYDTLKKDGELSLGTYISIDTLAMNFLNSVIHEIKSQPDIKHRYCNYSFNEYKSI